MPPRSIRAGPYGRRIFLRSRGPISDGYGRLTGKRVILRFFLKPRDGFVPNGHGVIRVGMAVVPVRRRIPAVSHGLPSYGCRVFPVCLAAVPDGDCLFCHQPLWIIRRLRKIGNRGIFPDGDCPGRIGAGIHAGGDGRVPIGMRALSRGDASIPQRLGPVTNGNSRNAIIVIRAVGRIPSLTVCPNGNATIPLGLTVIPNGYTTGRFGRRLVSHGNVVRDSRRQGQGNWRFIFIFLLQRVIQFIEQLISLGIRSRLLVVFPLLFYVGNILLPVFFPLMNMPSIIRFPIDGRVSHDIVSQRTCLGKIPYGHISRVDRIIFHVFPVHLPLYRSVLIDIYVMTRDLQGSSIRLIPYGI